MNIVCQRIIFGCLMMLMLTSFAGAQQSSPSVNPEQNNQTVAMSEDDRLPFMQDERTTTIAESSAGSMLLRTLGAMLLIVGLIFFGAWGLRKFGVNFGLFQLNNAAKEDAPDLEILNSVNLGNGRTLSVVRFGERNLLVGSTAQSFTLLADDTSEEQPLAFQPRSVAEMLAEENDSFVDELTAATSRLNSMCDSFLS